MSTASSWSTWCGDIGTWSLSTRQVSRADLVLHELYRFNHMVILLTPKLFLYFNMRIRNRFLPRTNIIEDIEIFCMLKCYKQDYKSCTGLLFDILSITYLIFYWRATYYICSPSYNIPIPHRSRNYCLITCLINRAIANVYIRFLYILNLEIMLFN